MGNLLIVLCLQCQACRLYESHILELHSVPLNARRVLVCTAFFCSFPFSFTNAFWYLWRINTYFQWYVLHIIFMGVGGFIYIPRTFIHSLNFRPLKKQADSEGSCLFAVHCTLSDLPASNFLLRRPLTTLTSKVRAEALLAPLLILIDHYFFWKKLLLC